MKRLLVIVIALGLSGCASSLPKDSTGGEPSVSNPGAQFVELDARLRDAGLERIATSEVIVTGIGEYFVARHMWPTSATEILAANKGENRAYVQHYLSKVTHLQLTKIDDYLSVSYHLTTKNGLVEERLRIQPKPTVAEILTSVFGK